MSTEKVLSRQVLVDATNTLSAFITNKGYQNAVTVTNWELCNDPSAFFIGEATALNAPTSSYRTVGVYIGTPDNGTLMCFILKTSPAIVCRSRIGGVWSSSWYNLEDSLNNELLSTYEALYAQANQLMADMQQLYDDIMEISLGDTVMVTKAASFTVSAADRGKWLRMAPPAWETWIVTFPSTLAVGTEFLFENYGEGVVQFEVDTPASMEIILPALSYPRLRGIGRVCFSKTVESGKILLTGALDDI